MYFIISFFLVCWMFQDFKRISYTARLRYLCAALCALFHPFIIGYLFLSREKRMAADRCNFFNAWTVPMLLVCLVLWYQLIDSSSIIPIIKDSYKRVRIKEDQIEEAQEFLFGLGVSDIYDTAALEGRTAVILKDSLENAKGMAGRGELRSYGKYDYGSWILDEDFPDYTISGWVFNNSSYIGKDSNRYAVVIRIDWEENIVLQEEELSIFFPKDYRSDGNYLFYLWAEDGSKTYSNDTAFWGNDTSFKFYGKSLWKKYNYHACVVGFVIGNDMPEYVTVSLAQRHGGIFGKDESVYSRKYDFHKLSGYPWEIGKEYEWSVSEQVSVYFSEEGVSNTGGELMVLHKDAAYASVNKDYRLEVEIDGQWRSIDIGRDWWGGAEEFLTRGKPYAFFVDWSERYGKLPPGKYRIVVPVNVQLWDEVRGTFYREFAICEFVIDE